MNVPATRLSHMAHNAKAKAIAFQFDICAMTPRLSTVNVARQVAAELTRRINALPASADVSRGLYLRDLATVNHALGIYADALGEDFWQ